MSTSCMAGLSGRAIIDYVQARLCLIEVLGWNLLEMRGAPPGGSMLSGCAIIDYAQPRLCLIEVIGWNLLEMGGTPGASMLSAFPILSGRAIIDYAQLGGA